VGVAVVSGVNLPPALCPSEDILELVTFFIERWIERDGDLAIGSGRKAGRDFARRKRRAKPVGITPLMPNGSLPLGRRSAPL
jgi:hypothetical protein